MTSVDRRSSGQPHRLFAMLALLALAACAGPSPDLTPTDADAAAPASAADATADGSAGEAAAEAAAVSAETPDAAASSATAVAPARVESSAPPAESAPVELSAPPAEPAAGTEAPSADIAEEPPPAEPAEAAAAPDIEPAPPPPGAPAETIAEPAAEPLPPAPVEEQPAFAAAAPSGGSFAPEPNFGLASDRPYVVIRFTDDAGDYQPALAEAIRRAVDRRPDVAFDLVAVTPRASNAEDLADDKAEAAAQADGVMQALADLGIGPDRVTMWAWTGQPTDVNEIRLYIR
jgi:hypothetical protein